MTIQKVGGWKLRHSKDVYENAWIKVSHQEVITPAGTDGIYGLVHFKNRAVGVIPIDSDGNTWLVRQSRYALDEFTWEIPEGGAPLNEDLLVAAQRELEEETGLIADHWRELTTIHHSNSVSDEIGVVFVASGLSEGTQQLEETEDITLRKLPLAEAVEMVLAGEITDSMSVAGLLRLALEQRVGVSVTDVSIADVSITREDA
ncbi:NUDIX domain-containing protein [Teredinibacter waterburyi]|jgi:NUDIX domain.|uniref:NUDIX domain-containing protein n=1 Tax=Teredinibacter waterburyi TaxID=1500538 RepID=UPI00165FC033|nr:NUDIX hydrolase [Teredinibacter waterburyi]